MLFYFRFGFHAVYIMGRVRMPLKFHAVLRGTVRLLSPDGLRRMECGRQEIARHAIFNNALFNITIEFRFL